MRRMNRTATIGEIMKTRLRQLGITDEDPSRDTYESVDASGRGCGHDHPTIRQAEACRTKKMKEEPYVTRCIRRKTPTGWVLLGASEVLSIPRNT